MEVHGLPAISRMGESTRPDRRVQWNYQNREGHGVVVGEINEFATGEDNAEMNTQSKRLDQP
jgi:hypothetical protein